MSKITRAFIAVIVPSFFAPSLTSQTEGGAGFAARKSSIRVYSRRTLRPVFTASAAASASTSMNLPPKPPPIVMPTTLTLLFGSPSAAHDLVAGVEDACVLV